MCCESRSVVSCSSEDPGLSSVWEDLLEKEMDTPVFLPGEFHGPEEPGGLHTVHGVTKSRTQLSG